MITSLPPSLIKAASSIVATRNTPSAFVSFKDFQNENLFEDSTTSDAVQDWISKRDNSRTAINQLNLDHTHTDDDKTHIFRYTAASRPLNKMLFAAHKDGVQPANEFPVSGRFNFTHDVKALDAAVSRNKLEHPLVTYSGVSWNPKDKMDERGILHLPAYTSTTTDKSVAHHFAKSNRKDKNNPIHVLSIHNPAGSSGVYTHNDSTITHYDTENEFIIPRKTTLQIHPEPEVHGELHIWHAHRIMEAQPHVDTSYVSKTPGHEEIYNENRIKVVKVNSLSSYKKNYQKFYDEDGGEQFHNQHVLQPVYHLHTPDGQIYKTHVSHEDSDEPVTQFMNSSGRTASIDQVMAKYPQIKHLEPLFQTKTQNSD